MSYLDRIAVCRHWDPEAYRPFMIDGAALGRVAHGFARGEGSDWRTPRWLRLTAMDLGAEIATRNAVDQCMT